MYSIHVDSEGRLSGDLDNLEYLLEDRNLKRLENLVDSLIESLQSVGSIIVWHKSFESTVNDRLADIFPDKKEALHKINQRMYDLETIFTKRYYQSGLFKGRTSIKQITAALCPDYDYSDKSLAIKDGNQATTEWQVAVDTYTLPQTRQDIFDNLRQYCSRDTWVMVEIYRHLKNIIIKN